MIKVLFILLIVLLQLDVALADENQVSRERIHSVRKVVDTVGKLDEKEVSIVDSFRNMFTDGKVSGQVRTQFSLYDQKALTQVNTHATAFGGIIKYELAEFNGFNAAAAVYTSHDIPFLSGSGIHYNPELSSSKGSYTDMAEAYINYKYQDFNLKVGRQTLDTPLADSDDIRMIQNTFEAYIASYNYIGVEFMAGYIDSWQGVDTGLDDGWVSVAKDGTNFGGISYSDGLEFNLWFYNITQQTNALYMDIGLEYKINDDMLLHLGAQYLNETTLGNSQVAADIYGGLFEFVFHDVGFNAVFNQSLKKANKQSFSGTGGGAMYTSMDTMIIDEIANDRDVFAYVLGISYSIDYFGFIYAHGDFVGKENSAGIKAHILEHDMGFSYDVNDEFLLSAIYVISEDKESDMKSQYDFDRVQLMVNYNF